MDLQPCFHSPVLTFSEIGEGSCRGSSVAVIILLFRLSVVRFSFIVNFPESAG